jgi:hypothetical protein
MFAGMLLDRNIDDFVDSRDGATLEVMSSYLVCSSNTVAGGNSNTSLAIHWNASVRGSCKDPEPSSQVVALDVLLHCEVVMLGLLLSYV